MTQLLAKRTAFTPATGTDNPAGSSCTEDEMDTGRVILTGSTGWAIMGDGVVHRAPTARSSQPGVPAGGRWLTGVPDRRPAGPISASSPPATDRVKPPCPPCPRPAADASLQHAADPFVADWKQGVVVQAALAGAGADGALRGRCCDLAGQRSRRRATLSGAPHQGRGAAGFPRPAGPTRWCRNPGLQASAPRPDRRLSRAFRRWWRWAGRARPRCR
jgi:hypothetical protein